jgi:hypothetical protein
MTYPPTSFSTVAYLTPTTTEEDRSDEPITIVVVAIAFKALQLFIK